MANGVTTVNLNASSLVDSVVGSYAGSTVRVEITRLVALINSLLGPTYAAQSELYADLSWPAGAVGYVRGDATSAYNGVYVKEGASGAGLWSRVGDLPSGAVETALLDSKAPLASPALTGMPTAPTAASGTATTQIASTAFVQAALASLVGSAPGALDTLNELAAALGNDPNLAATMTAALAAKAPLASPALTGAPTAPTAVSGTATTQIASTAFVQAALAAKAALESPAFTGVPTAPTAAVGTNTTQLATAAFVQDALAPLLSRSDALASLLADVITTAGQTGNFSALANTSTYNAKTYAVAAARGTLTDLSLYSTGATAVSASICVWSNSGGTLTLISSAPITIVQGLNSFSGLAIDIPDGAAVGVKTDGASLYIGSNSTLALVPFMYATSAADPVTTSTLTRGIMMSATVTSLTETVTGVLDTLASFLVDVTDRYVADIDLSALTTSTGTGMNLMVIPDQVILEDGRITSVEVVQTAASVGTKYLLIFDFDGVSTYTKVSSTPITLAAGYNSIAVDVPVTAGQVIGLGGLIGTSTTDAPAQRTIYASSGTVLVDGVDPSGNYNWAVNVNVTRTVLQAGSTAAAPVRRAARVVELDGQSNADGQTSTAVNLSSYGNLMYTSGLRTLYTTPNRTALAPILEATRTTGLNIATAYATELLIERAGAAAWSDLNSVYFGASGALGGQTIENIFDFSGTIWPNSAANIRAAGELLREAGYDPFFAFYVWIQGYSNRADARGVYAPKIRAGLARVRGGAGNGMPGVPMFIGAQMPHHKQSDPANNPNVALDLRDVAIEAGGEIIPLYPAEWADRGIHMTTNGNVYKGLMLGKMMADLDAGTARHVHLKANTWGSSSIVLDIVGGVGAYAFDTTTIAAAPNMGFDAYSSAGALLTGVVTGASLAGTQITLTTSRALVAGERITYGWGRSDMPIPSDAAPGPYRLGNLRDTDARSRVVSGVTYNLWNWAVIQEIVR